MIESIREFLKGPLRDDVVEIHVKCPFCGETSVVEVPRNEWEDYNAGALAQDAFKSLDATGREKIITGMCDKCQKETFEEE